MNSKLDITLQQIKENNLFQKLREVSENHDGWHDNEDIYSHCVKSADIAKEKKTGSFINNEESRKLFLKWMDEEIFGTSRRDVVVLTALLHDCGKILHYKENREIKEMKTHVPQTTNQTIFPGHEYWGAKIAVKEILRDIDISDDLKRYIASIIKLHGTLNSAHYFQEKENWSIEELINNVKAQAEGYYMEALFNAYCDCYNAEAFSGAKEKIEAVFNTPSFYTPREYFIPE